MCPNCRKPELKVLAERPTKYAISEQTTGTWKLIDHRLDIPQDFVYPYMGLADEEAKITLKKALAGYFRYYVHIVPGSPLWSEFVREVIMEDSATRFTASHARAPGRDLGAYLQAVLLRFNIGAAKLHDMYMIDKNPKYRSTGEFLKMSRLALANVPNNEAARERD